MLWYEHQVQVKRSMHGSGPRLANADVVTHATPSVVRAQTTAWERANPQYFKHITATESFTGGVPKKMIGGKAFWYFIANAVITVCTCRQVMTTSGCSVCLGQQASTAEVSVSLLRAYPPSGFRSPEWGSDGGVFH
jgi:hypothetical protein